MRKLPPLHALRAFEAAARHLHFANAADELGLTPTAISHQVRLLEETLGAKLFIRQTRPISLTSEGAKLLPVLRDALDQIEATLHSISAPNRNRPIVLSVTLAFASRWLLPRLARLQSQTQVAISLDARNTPVDLSSGSADIAIRYAPASHSHPHWNKICTDHFIAVATPDIAENLDLSHPGHTQLLHYDWTSPNMAAPAWQDWFKNAGLQRGVHWRSQKFSEEVHAIEACEAGQGVTLASHLLVSDQIESGALVRVSDTILAGPDYWVLFPDDHPRSSELQKVMDWFIYNMPK